MFPPRALWTSSTPRASKKARPPDKFSSPPFLPKVKDDKDTSNFDDYPDSDEDSAARLTPKEAELFVEFDYMQAPARHPLPVGGGPWRGARGGTGARRAYLSQWSCGGTYPRLYG